MATQGIAARWALPAIIGLAIGIVGGVFAAPLLEPSTEAPHRVAAPLPDEAERKANAPSQPLSEPADSGAAALLKQRNQRISDLLAEIETLKQRPDPAESEPPPEPEAEPIQPPTDAAMELRSALGRTPTDAELQEYASLQQQNHAVALNDYAETVKEREAAAAALRDGDVMVLLRNMETVSQNLKDTVSSPEQFAKFFERKINGPAISGTDVHSATLQDGTTVRFAAGLHNWRVSQLGRRQDEPFPKDLLLVGAGRDETLLSLDEFNANSEVRSLTFQDLTLDCANNYLTDLRSENPITIRFERCRIVRFDMGAGGSVMLAARNAAFYATDTLIECGYGRSPSSGNVFRCTKLLARLERCTLSWVGSDVGLRNSETTFAVFVGCKFIQVRNLLTEPAENATVLQRASFTGCTFEGEEDARYIDHQLKLEDINPAWKDAQ